MMPPTHDAGHDADGAQRGAFEAEHASDLASRDAEVTQHAEFAAAREHLRTGAGADAEQTDQYRDRLEQVRHRERAVEQRQRAIADFGGQRDVVIARALQRRPQCDAEGVRVDAVTQPDRGGRRVTIASQFDEALTIHDDGTARAVRSRATRRGRWHARPCRRAAGRTACRRRSHAGRARLRTPTPERCLAGRVADPATNRQHLAWPSPRLIGRAMTVSGKRSPGITMSWKRTKSTRSTPWHDR